MCNKRYYTKYMMQMGHILRTAHLVKYKEGNGQLHLKMEEWIRESTAEDLMFKLNLEA